MANRDRKDPPHDLERTAKDRLVWSGSRSRDRALPEVQITVISEVPAIHRFKGLERDLIILVELRPDDERLEKLLYIGASRAKHHLAVIVPPEVAQRLGIIAT